MDKQKHSLIVFCGMDGSGKTTLARKVCDFLRNSNVEFEYLHAHGYSVSNNSFGVDESKINRWRLLFKLLIPFAFLDNLFTYYSKYKPILRNKILVCDRYFYDKTARMLYYGICGRFIAKIYLRLVPKPDYVFFLDADPNQVYYRKGEYSEEEYNSFKNIYRFIANFLKVPVIDTNFSIDDSYKRILSFLDK